MVRWLEWLEGLHVWARALALATLFVAMVVADAATGLDFTLLPSISFRWAPRHGCWAEEPALS